MPAAAAIVLIAFVATVMFSRRIREQQEQLWRTDSVPAEGNVRFTDTDAARTPIGLSTGDSTEVQAARRKERAQPELGRGRADFSTGKIALHSATGAGQDVPLLIMLISLIAAIYLLENLPFLVAAMGIISLGILDTVIFARRNRQPLDPGNVSFTEDADAVPQPIGQETGLSAEAQAVRQPAFTSAASAPQSTPQLQWTLACDDAVAALVSLKRIT